MNCATGSNDPDGEGQPFPSRCAHHIAFSSHSTALYCTCCFLPCLLQQTVSNWRAGMELYPFQSRPNHFYSGDLKHRTSQIQTCIRVIREFLPTCRPSASNIMGSSLRVCILTSGPPPLVILTQVVRELTQRTLLSQQAQGVSQGHEIARISPLLHLLARGQTGTSSFSSLCLSFLSDKIGMTRNL